MTTRKIVLFLVFGILNLEKLIFIQFGIPSMIFFRIGTVYIGKLALHVCFQICQFYRNQENQ
ncbi:MAG: hypothetical protein BGO33_09120 [Bacteroidia bacterium 43-41]|nr:MAG: hypothetical protein BGO33_09120 [Bacteroidia bacterium 43-41]